MDKQKLKNELGVLRMFKPALFGLIASISLFAYADVTLKGEMQQGGLILGKTESGNQVYLNNKRLEISKTGEFVFGFSRDETKKHTLEIKSPNGLVETRNFVPKKRTYNIQRINGIKKSIMKPNPKAIARVKEDNKKIGAARKISSDLMAFSMPFIAPIDGTITGVYGSQRVFNGVPKNPHYGLDYAGDVGDPVMAPADGTVLMFEPDMFYSGGTMIIDHGKGISSTFLHLSKSYVKQGDTVKQGDVVAAVGKSGRATGPHLDWRINWFNMRLDPALVLKIK